MQLQSSVLKMLFAYVLTIFILLTFNGNAQKREVLFLGKPGEETSIWILNVIKDSGTGKIKYIASTRAIELPDETIENRIDVISDYPSLIITCSMPNDFLEIGVSTGFTMQTSSSRGKIDVLYKINDYLVYDQWNKQGSLLIPPDSANLLKKLIKNRMKKFTLYIWDSYGKTYKYTFDLNQLIEVLKEIPCTKNFN